MLLSRSVFSPRFCWACFLHERAAGLFREGKENQRKKEGRRQGRREGRKEKRKKERKEGARLNVLQKPVLLLGTHHNLLNSYKNFMALLHPRGFIGSDQTLNSKGGRSLAVEMLVKTPTPPILASPAPATCRCRSWAGTSDASHSWVSQANSSL